MYLKSRLTLTFTNILLFSTLCFAETPFDLEKEKTKLSNKIFNHYDIDKNSSLSFDEFILFSKDIKKKEEEKRAEKMIKSCDKDGNGTIEFTELLTQKELRGLFKSGGRKMHNFCTYPKSMFQQMDTNENESITKLEILVSYQQRMRGFGVPPVSVRKRDELKDFKERLTSCDKNEDGNLTLIEATAKGCYLTSDVFLEYSSNPKKSFKIADIKKSPTNGKSNRANLMFKKCDKNQDNKVSLVEATSMFCHITSDMFIEMDENNDSFLLKEDLKKMFGKRDKPLRPKFEEMAKNMPKEMLIPMAFSMCNENRDEKMTKKEAQKCGIDMKLFNAFDSDKSETIEENDLEIIQVRREFDMVDMNEDKKINAKEFAERMGNRCRVF
jgi:Ca2+-binding EF-hand superfamily protein